MEREWFRCRLEVEVLVTGHTDGYADDAAYDQVISVAAGHLDTVDAITAILQTATRPRR